MAYQYYDPGIEPEIKYPGEGSTPAPPIPAPEESFPVMIRRIAREQGWSEDFERFSDGQIEAWKKFWDPQRQRFRSQHAPEGAGEWAYVEKPTESVIDPETGHEFGPWGNKIGVDLTDIPKSQGGKGPEVAPKAPAAPAGPAAPAVPEGLLFAPTPKETPQQTALSDMQRALEEKFLSRQGIFGFGNARSPSSGTAGDLYAKSLKAGGLWWGGEKNMFDKDNLGTPTAPAAPAAPAAPKTLEDALVKKRKRVVAGPVTTSPIRPGEGGSPYMTSSSYAGYGGF